MRKDARWVLADVEGSYWKIGFSWLVVRRAV